uniref:Ubiquitin-conjugating enzyme family protein n=1 Tax=Kwoniella pini CBS 10737 TaxID=1296096 RepID=A0A1B9HXP7_9TREE|nr:uncharacterized protein I206_05913 [Kwoniella pini CBS 10737]OCF48046.1 hypothetical protein I206_05913 [Kwoniella pini CBS 10737]
MPDPALVQMMDMGIPGARARAALKKSKGDVMSAAEKVFQGDFDDIPSDDDSEYERASSSKSGGVILIEDSDIDMEEDSDGSEADDEGFAGFEDDGGVSEDRLLSDPYAGIFFSKDRVERIMEPVEEDRYVKVILTQGQDEHVKVLRRAAWMSGCPEGSEQSFLFQLYSTLAEGSMPCSAGCGHQFSRHEKDFFLLFSDYATYTTYLNSKIRPICPQCSQATCLACGERVNDIGPFDEKGKNPFLVSNDVLLHCPNLQGVLLGVGLHMIEQAFSTQHESRSLTTSIANPPSKKQNAGAIHDNLKKTVKISSKGTGYSGSSKEDRTGQVKAGEAQKAADERILLLLSQIQIFLPNLDRVGGPKTSDHLVHPTALAHLRRRSAFINDLLRNDSLLDMSQRAELYTSLLDWLKLVSNHEALASMLAMPQMRPVSIAPCPDSPGFITVTYEGSSSPRELLENCVIQAQAALKGLQAVSDISKPKEIDMTEEEKRLSRAEVARREREQKEGERLDANAQLRTFCEKIVYSAQAIDRSLIETKGEPFVERMKESLPRLPKVGVLVEEQSVTGLTEEAKKKIYEKWAGRARFQYCDLTEPSTVDKKAYRHAFDGSIQSLEGMDMPKRSLAIAKELAILTTSLPVAWHSTIFLRVDETRVDVLKAMIIGPEGTPYENGCFIFDIFLPLDYNLRCPHVKSMTTNGGKYRLNPNLYADGKVCLSLLGTWQGPGWISGQSTLLQVLISIQSLILCEEPYTNEPGKYSQQLTPASKAYSANVRRMVLVDAMANNIKRPPHPFESEIKTHFRLKSRSIKQQIGNWRKLDDGKPISGDSYSSGLGQSDKANFNNAAKEVIRLLDQLENVKSIINDGR